MFISIDVIYFLVTVVCGIMYGIFCHHRGMKIGAQNAIDYMEDLNYIQVDEETGEIFRVSDREFRK